jgi:hypothetical protein
MPFSRKDAKPLKDEGVDTVVVWGSNPHAPTIFISNTAESLTPT